MIVSSSRNRMGARLADPFPLVQTVRLLSPETKPCEHVVGFFYNFEALLSLKLFHAQTVVWGPFQSSKTHPGEEGHLGRSSQRLPATLILGFINDQNVIGLSIIRFLKTEIGRSGCVCRATIVSLQYDGIINWAPERSAGITYSRFDQSSLPCWDGEVEKFFWCCLYLGSSSRPGPFQWTQVQEADRFISICKLLGRRRSGRCGNGDQASAASLRQNVVSTILLSSLNER